MISDRLDRIDRHILNAIQAGFPVDPRPYLVLAERLNADDQLGLTEEDVWSRVKALRGDGFIRRLGAIFNAGPLGYRSVLCAARVPADRLEDFSRRVNLAPQVTHNYLRSDDLNLWFTFTSEHREELDEFLTGLKSATGVNDVYVLESEKLFKIKVNFKFSDPD